MQQCTCYEAISLFSGVLTKMPEAPSARALKTSVPRRTPPSKNTGTRPCAAFTTCHNRLQNALFRVKDFKSRVQYNSCHCENM